MKNLPQLLFFVLILGAAAFFFFKQQQKAPDTNEMNFSTLEEIQPDWIDELAKQQIATSSKSSVFHNFKFSDQLPSSNITFSHQIVPDCTYDFKPVHYDHGNGLSIADIDGDGKYDIYFVSQVGKGELWKNLGNGKFTNITDASGLAITEKDINVASSFGDIDNDGDPDLFVTNVRNGNKLFRNDGGGKFSEISKAAGVNHRGHSSGATFFDFNKDGLLDLFVSVVGQYTTEEVADFKYGNDSYQYNVGFKDGFAGHLKEERFESSILYKNLGGNKFEDVTQAMGLVDNSWTGDATFIDGNEDGFPDLYLLNMQGNDQYYENQGGKSFAKKSNQLFPKTPWGAMGIRAFDYNNDGMQDIFISDMHSDMGANVAFPVEKERAKGDAPFPDDFLVTPEGAIFGNAFFKKTGPDQYEEVSDAIGAENYWPWGLSTGDLNADGFEDVFLASSMNYLFRYTMNNVLLNNQGKDFIRSEFILGVEPRRDGQFGKKWFSIDCSGAFSSHPLCKNKSGEQVYYGALGSRSSVIFDLDDDGDLDIVTNELNSVPLVLISNLSTTKTDLKYLKVKLTGTTSNRDGIGAKVIVKAGDSVYTKIHDGKSGYLSQSSFPLYFGLGDADKIDEVKVIWPSGKEQVVREALALNGLMEITER